MNCFIFTVLLVWAACASAAKEPRQRYKHDKEADVTCYSLLNSNIGKTLWPIDGDCHRYYECRVAPKSKLKARAIERSCKAGMFFNYEVQECIPEGPIECKDMCENPLTRRRGCFAIPNSCTTYFECTMGRSYSQCCPHGTRFNEETCQCDIDMTCRDECKAESHEDEIAVMKVLNNEENFDLTPEEKGACKDDFGNQLTPDARDKRKFYFSDGKQHVEMTCKAGTIFHVESCQCQNEAMENERDVVCMAYFPFDKDFAGHSVGRFFGQTVGHTTIDRTHAAHGRGSAMFRGDNSKIFYEGIRNFDFGEEATICFFYKCADSRKNPTECLREGTLLSSEDKLGYGTCLIDLVSRHNNSFQGSVGYSTADDIDEIATMTGPRFENVGKNGFNQVCIISKQSQIYMYINKEFHSVFDMEPGSTLKMARCRLSVGNGKKHGAFIGNIDELLLCRKALSPQQVAAHYDGPEAMIFEKVIPSQKDYRPKLK